jgi:ATP-dependent Clp protease ATP-binding subunit ClpA
MKYEGMNNSVIGKYEEKKNELSEKSEEIINELTGEMVNKYFSPEFINRIDEVIFLCSLFMPYWTS